MGGLKLKFDQHRRLTKLEREKERKEREEWERLLREKTLLESKRKKNPGKRHVFTTRKLEDGEVFGYLEDDENSFLKKQS